jgi:hypothetical protein
VRDFLAANFGGDGIAAGPASVMVLLDELVGRRIVGGATYDAVIAVVARELGATLVSCDRRAWPTYTSLGVTVQFLA